MLPFSRITSKRGLKVLALDENGDQLEKQEI
jgi:hypothetical protein